MSQSESNINQLAINSINEPSVDTEKKLADEPSVDTEKKLADELSVDSEKKLADEPSVDTEKKLAEKPSVDSEKSKNKGKKPYLKTKVFYKFTKKSGKETLSEIKSRTDDLKSIGAPTMMTNGVCETVNREDYIEDLLYEINKATIVYYGTLNAPEDGSINKKVIGKGGCYFYKTTYDNNIFFIWHNKETKSYEFWGGDYYGMINSMNAISHRIEKCSE